MGKLLGIQMTWGTAETETLENNLTKAPGIRMPEVLASVKNRVRTSRKNK